MVKTLVLVKKAVAYHNWFALPERPVSDACASFASPEYSKMVLSKNVMRNVARFRIRGHGLRCETVLYGRSPDRSACVCNLCDEKHVPFSCLFHLFDNISDGDIKCFVFNIFISAALDLFDSYLSGPFGFRLSSHARLEGFVFQTKLNTKPHQRPQHLTDGLLCKLSNLLKRLRAHTLKVEAAAWLEDGSCVCDQCPGEDEHVQNEVHALLICQDHRVCELRKHFSFLFTPFFENFSAAQPFLPQQVNNQLVHDFLSQQNNRLFLFSF